MVSYEHDKGLRPGFRYGGRIPGVRLSPREKEPLRILRTERSTTAQVTLNFMSEGCSTIRTLVPGYIPWSFVLLFGISSGFFIAVMFRKRFRMVLGRTG